MFGIRSCNTCLLYAGHHSNAWGDVLLGLGDGNDCLWSQRRHVLALNLQNLISGLQPCQVGAAALLHRQNVAGSRAPQLEAEFLRPALVGSRHAEN